MKKIETFTKENFEALKRTCKNITSLCDENVDGNLMFSQLLCLADGIKDFNENPIIKNSGIK